MASLDRLPDELKVAIISNVTFRDFDSLSRTCRNLRAVCFPALFYSITMTWEHGQDLRPKLISLLRVLLEDPRLISNVKSITLRGRDCEHVLAQFSEPKEELPPLNTSFRPGDSSLITKALDEAKLEQSGKWKEAIFETGSLTAIAALLVARCTHLESLALDFDFLLYGSWFLMALRHVKRPGTGSVWPRFEKLRKAAVCCAPKLEHTIAYHCSPPLHSFLCFFYLPRVETLELCLMPNYCFSEHSIVAGGSWPFIIEPSPTHLSTLRLIRSPVAAANLKVWLEGASSLSTFEFDCFFPSSETPFDLLQLRLGLECVRSTLRSLIVRYEVFAESERRVEDLISVCNGSVGSLSTFTALTSLQISLALLLGRVPIFSGHALGPLLPPNLETLTLTDDLWGYAGFNAWASFATWDVFKEFLEGEVIVATSYDDADDSAYAYHLYDKVGPPGWKTATPGLREFVFNMRKRGWAIYDDSFGYSDREELRRACEKQGLQCSILVNEDFEE